LSGLDGASGREGVALELEKGGGKGSVAGGLAWQAGRLMGWAEGHWIERPNGPAKPTGPKLKRNSFRNKNWIFEFTKALEIFHAMIQWIFPKFF
jgi:hypothetical protein